VQIKRLRFQIEQAFNSQKDPFHLLNTLQKLEADPQVENPHAYHLIPLDFKIDYPDYHQITKTDPRFHLQATILFWS